MARVLRRLAHLALSLSVLSAGAAPARLLFPKSLHLTRQIQDPLSAKTITMEEYCFGNRMVTITEDRTVVVDYEKQEVTEIDRHAGTYSLTRFDEIASVIAETSKTALMAKPQRNWKATPLGVRGAAGRSVEQFEFVDSEATGRKVEVGVDRSITLSRDAVEVLIGAAYPNPVRDEHDAVLRAANARGIANREVKTNSADEGDASYSLPLTQAFTYADSGTEITFRTNITRVGAETVPAEALIIPPASKRVESRSTTIQRQLRELDQPASPRGN